MVHERARERHALLLAARQLSRLALGQVRQLDRLQRLGDALLDLALEPPLRSRPKATFFSIVRCGKSAYDWKTVLTSRLCGGAFVTIGPPRLTTPSVGSSKPADHPQRRRLAAARRPHQGVERAALDLEVEIVDDEHLAEPLRDSREPDVRLATATHISRLIGDGLSFATNEHLRVPADSSAPKYACGAIFTQTVAPKRSDFASGERTRERPFRAEVVGAQPVGP